ncbi:MAG: Calx-beta domain-containing protein, partial [Thermoanaerobaculia bacterium]
VTLNEPVPAGQSIWVDFATSAGTATVNSDYASTGGTLIFTGGQTSNSASVAILEDGIRENAESFTISLVGASNAHLGAATDTTVIIAANDSLTLPASYAEMEEGIGALIEITLNAPSAQSVTVGYATKDGTALAGSDYVATSGTVTFVPGQTSRMIGVSTLGDGVAEGNETFTLSLSAPSNAQLGKPASMKITIVESSTDL